MDWPAFFKDNSQSIFTLAGVFLGSIMTLAISYVNNRFQGRERDKDRVEQRREAKLQNRQKWIERDILQLMDSIDMLLKYLLQFEKFSHQIDDVRELKEAEVIKEDEVDTRLKMLYDSSSTLQSETMLASNVMSKLVHSFGEDEIGRVYEDFLEAITAFQVAIYPKDDLNSDEIEDTGSDKWLDVQETAGKFHQALRNKLISLRDT